MVDIIFYTEFTRVNRTAITDINALREVGDQKIASLVESLSSSGGGKSCGQELKATLSILGMSIAILIFLLL